MPVLRQRLSEFPLIQLLSVWLAPSVWLDPPPPVVAVALHVPPIDALQLCGPGLNPPEELITLVRAFLRSQIHETTRVTVNEDAQRRDVVTMANHWVLLMTAVAAVLWMTVVVRVEEAQASVLNVEAADVQSLSTDHALKLVLKVGPY